MGRVQTGEVAPTGRLRLESEAAQSRAAGAPAEEGEPTGAGLDARMREAAQRELREFEKQSCPRLQASLKAQKAKAQGPRGGTWQR